MSSALTYAARSTHFTNPAAKRLLELMERKKTNLSVAVDVTKKDDLLRLANAVGPEICLLKTHIDIVEDFDQDLVDRLVALAKQHDFLIFEDRKFADIGNTVKLQYSAGVHRISSWSDITNAHVVPGPGIISGLSEVGLALGRGLLLLAEMSSAGSLAKGPYTETAVSWARENRDFVVGFVAGRRLTPAPTIEEDFIYMSPGVGLEAKGDSLGQQYRTPKEVILECKSDIIIVGRGIYSSGKDPRSEAKRYREAGWAAYEERIREAN